MSETQGEVQKKKFMRTYGVNFNDNKMWLNYTCNLRGDIKSCVICLLHALKCLLDSIEIDTNKFCNNPTKIKLL